MGNLKRILLIVLCPLILVMSGCGASEDNKEGELTQEHGTSEDNNQDEPVQENGTYSWQASYLLLENQYDLAVVTDNNIYGCRIEDNQVIIESFNRENFSVDNTFVLSDVSYLSYLSSMAADGEGNVYVFDSWGEDNGIWKIDADGSHFISMEVEHTENAVDIRPKGIHADKNGYLFLWYEMMVPELETVEGIERNVYHSADRIYVKDEQFNTVSYVQIDNMSGTKLLTFQMDEEGKPLLIAKDTEGVYIQEIDAERGELKDEIRLEDLPDSVTTSLIYGLEHIVLIDNGLLVCQDNDLFELHFDTQELEKILSLSTYGIFSSDILYLAKNGDTIEIIDNHGSAESSEFVSLAMRESEKQLITLGVTMKPQDLERVVTEFNRYNDEYSVEIIDYYGRENSYDDALERLKLDVVTGNAPDIIGVSGIDYDVFSKKGVLADLYEFMQEDSECQKSMLMQSVIEAYESGGHLYSIAPAFQLHSMWGNSAVIKGRSGVTFKELIQILEDSGNDLNAITGFAADEPALTSLCTVAMDEFVDWENRTCEFDGEYFKEVLQFAKDYTGRYTGGTYPERIHRGEIVMSVGIISGVADYQMQAALYGGNTDFIGYPTANSSGTVIAYRGSAVAINAANGNQTGAWEFVKFYLLQGYDGQGFPIMKQRFDEEMAAAMVEDFAVTEEGGTERLPKDSYYAGDDYYIFVYAATQEDVDVVVKLVESAENRYQYHTEIQNIINEEAEAYFSGQKDLDSTVEVIQNRVTLFLQE